MFINVNVKCAYALFSPLNYLFLKPILYNYSICTCIKKTLEGIFLNKITISGDPMLFVLSSTDLEDDAPDIIRANAGRWIIENGFWSMKNEFEARPVYLQRDDRIEAYFLTCFLALLLYKYLEKNSIGG